MVISVSLGFLLGNKPIFIGFTYLIIAPIVHHFTYGYTYKNECYYYFNLGLSSHTLWGSTFIVALFNLLILSFA